MLTSRSWNGSYGQRRASTEVKALKRLISCVYAPTYLGDFKRREGPGVVTRYVLMTKVPGYALSESDLWRQSSARVESAFNVAIRSVLHWSESMFASD